jgi:hypothetical protein
MPIVSSIIPAWYYETSHEDSLKAEKGQDDSQITAVGIHFLRRAQRILKDVISKGDMSSSQNVTKKDRFWGVPSFKEASAVRHRLIL